METEAASPTPDPPRFLSRMPSRWVLLTLLCLALVVRGRMMLGNLDSLEKDPDAYRDAAWNIYFEGTLGFWNDASGAVEPTATRPPLYPLLLSGMYFLRFTPDGPGIGLLHVLLGTCTVWIVWRLGLAWRLPPAASLLAAALVMVDPDSIESIRAGHDRNAGHAAHGDRAIGASRAPGKTTDCAGRRWPARHWDCACSVGRHFWCGCWRRPSCFRGWPSARAVSRAPRHCWPERPRCSRRGQFAMSWFSVARSSPPRTAVTRCCWPTIPSSTRTCKTRPGAACGMRDDFNEHWRSEQQGHGSALDPADRELDSDRRAYAAAWENIARDPLVFAYSCVVRLGRLWNVLPHQTSPDESASRHGLRLAVAIWYTLELLLAAAGIAYLRRRLLLSPWAWGTILVVSLSAVHTIFWTDMRMRAPLVIVVALLAAQGVLLLATRRQASSAEVPTT